MNAAFLLMSSALAPGGDVTPAGWGERPPAVVQAGGCCGSVGPTVASSPASQCCDSCGSAGKPKLLDRLKAKFATKSSGCGCAAAPAPTCCAPAPAPLPAPVSTSCCDSCGSQSRWSQPNLFDKIKARMASKKSCGCGTPSTCNTCGSTPGYAPLTPGCATPLAPGMMPVTPGTGTPKEMPKKELPRNDPKETGKPGDDAPPPAALAPPPAPAAPAPLVVPTPAVPGSVALPPVPVAPLADPRPTPVPGSPY